jgi:hypothetical protein
MEGAGWLLLSVLFLLVRVVRPEASLSSLNDARYKVYAVIKQLVSSGRILERNWDKSLKSFPPCYSEPPLLPDFTHSTPLTKVV